MEGKRKIMLGSNNYLGLTVNEEVKNSAIKQSNNTVPVVRVPALNGTLNLHLELEKKLADFLGYESAMTFFHGISVKSRHYKRRCRQGRLCHMRQGKSRQHLRRLQALRRNDAEI